MSSDNFVISSIAVRGLGSAMHTTDEYVLLNLYFSGIGSRIAQITREVHVLNKLRAKALIAIDILSPDEITMDLAHKLAVIHSHGKVAVALSSLTRSNQRQ